MRILLIALFLNTVALAEESLVMVQGGVSPDSCFAVAVVPQKPGEFVDEADGTVYLLDHKTKKRIGPLEEVDSTGGTWGSTTENVRAIWSPDGRHLVINFRAGRLMSGYQLYRIQGRRAIPLTLPDPAVHPKGKILSVLTTTANPGASLTWENSTTLIESSYGHTPKAGHFDEDYSKYGLPNFDGLLEYVYVLDKTGRWKVSDVRTPKANQ